MPIVLDGPSGGDTRYTINLEGQGYDVRLRWNSRSESWYAYIGLQGYEPSLKTRLVTGRDLLESYRNTLGVPPGSLVLVDTQKDYGRPSFDDFGFNGRFQLVYIRTTEDNPFNQQ